MGKRDMVFSDTWDYQTAMDLKQWLEIFARRKETKVEGVIIRAAGG